MDGKKYMASRLATTWRRTLMRGKPSAPYLGLSSQAEHLGLLPNQPAFDGKVQPTTNMHPAPVLNEYDFGSSEDLAVQDILSDEFQTLWHGTGEKNREAFKTVFLPVQSDDIKNWKQYDEFLKPHAGVPVRLSVSATDDIADEIDGTCGQ